MLNILATFPKRAAFRALGREPLPLPLRQRGLSGFSLNLHILDCPCLLSLLIRLATFHALDLDIPRCLSGQIASQTQTDDVLQYGNNTNHRDISSGR